MSIARIIDREGQQKLYVQVYMVMRRLIDAGEWIPESLIPSEDALCKTFNVSKATVRLALADLVREGYLRRQQGKGTYVKSPLPDHGLQVTTRLSDDFFGVEERLEKAVLWKGVKEVADEADEHLPLRGTLFHILRRGTIDEDPVTLEELFVPVNIAPGIDGEDVAKVPFLAMLRNRANVKIDRVLQTVEGVRLKGADADMFGFREGHPAIRLHLVPVQAGNLPMAYIRMTGRIARCRIRTDFERMR